MRERGVVEHSPVSAPRQSDGGDSKHVSRWGRASASMRTMPCRNPHQEVSCHCTEEVSCDKSRLQEATREFSLFPGGEQVHSYLGIPASTEIMHA